MLITIARGFQPQLPVPRAHAKAQPLVRLQAVVGLDHGERIDLDGASPEIPSILRLTYRAELTMLDGRTATGTFDLRTNRIFGLRDDPGAAPRLEPVR